MNKSGTNEGNWTQGKPCGRSISPMRNAETEILSAASPTRPRRWSSIRFDRPCALLCRSRACSRPERSGTIAGEWNGERRQVGPESLDKWSENSRLLIRRCIKYVRANGSPVLKVHRRCMLCLLALSPSTEEIYSSPLASFPLLLCHYCFQLFRITTEAVVDASSYLEILAIVLGNLRASFGFGRFRRF